MKQAPCISEVPLQRGVCWKTWSGPLYCFILSVLVLILADAPAAAPENAPPADFSAARAMKHVHQIAREPHRAGTPANKRVRDYLFATLSALGLHPQLSEILVTRGNKAGNPQNILARIPGTHSTKAFLLMAHYDSVPYGPGAADNGAGVAAILETARAVLAGPPLQNDLILLLTDGEERGLWGAKAYRDHPWCKDTGLLLNLESRGVRGPSYLFETNRKNGWLIPRIAQAGGRPFLSSIMFEVYSRLPFTTDYHMLRDIIPGMNIAMIGYFPYYHSAHDKPQNLSLRSLQHHGSYALSFARYFGNIPLDGSLLASDVIYFNPIGSHLVYYPAGFSPILSLLTVVLFGIFLVWGIRNGHWTIHSLFPGMKAVVIVILGVAASQGVVLALIFWYRDLYALFFDHLFWSLLASVAILVFSELHAWCRGNVRQADLALGFLGWWVIGLCVAHLFLPQAGFLCQWPLLGSLFASFIHFSRLTHPPLPGFPYVLFLLGFAPAIALHVPLIRGLGEALTFLSAPVLVPYAIMIAGFNYLAWDEPLLLIRDILRKGAFVSVIVTFLLGLACSAPDQDHPRMNSVAYLLDSETAKAQWLSIDRKPDEWTAQFFPTNAFLATSSPYFPGPFLHSSAPVATFPPPHLEILSDQETPSGTRRLTMFLTSPRQGNRVRLFGSSSAEIRSLSVEQQPVEVTGATWMVDYTIFPETGAQFFLELAKPASLTLQVMDITYQLPQGPGFLWHPRPSHFMPKSNVITRDHPFETDTTMVVASFTF